MPHETRRWRFVLDDGAHVVELGHDSVWTDRPRHLVLDGTRLRIRWQKTTSWWRDWNVARWRWEFPVGTHRATLVCEKRQPPKVRTRARVVLGGAPKAAAADLAGRALTGGAATGGLSAGVFADRLGELRRTAYTLHIDGRIMPGSP